MLPLTTTSDVIQLVTTAAGQIDAFGAYADVTGTTVTVGRQVTRITTATTTTVVSAPGASTSRNIKRLAVSNNHASVTNTVTFQFFDGTNTVIFEVVTLAPGERFSYSETAGIRIFDASGIQKTQESIRASGMSNTADVVANAADAYLTGSGLVIGGRIQVGSFVKWRFRATKTAAGVASAAFNVRLGTTGTTTDTARTTLTSSAIQTAAVDTAMFELDTNFRAVGATGVIESVIRMDHTAADGAGMGTFRYLVATSATFDTTTAGLIIGVSCNPGAAGVWTFQYISAEANFLLP
jgi:hypothetical protein